MNKIKKQQKETTQDKFKFSKNETWFLKKLIYTNDMVLNLFLIAGKKEAPTDLMIGNVNIGPAYPVVHDPSRKVTVRFYQPLSFQRLDESFADEKGEGFSGGKFGTYVDSEYLKYYSKVSFGITEEPIKHYCISCADDILSILTTDEPEILEGWQRR